MLYQITGKQIDIGEALQTHAKSVVDAIAAKYAERPTDATIIFSRSANEFVCEVSVHLSTGITAQANAHDSMKYIPLLTLHRKKWRSNCADISAD